MQKKTGFLLIAIRVHTPYQKSFDEKGHLLEKKLQIFGIHAEKLINTLLEEIIKNFEPVYEV